MRIESIAPAMEAGTSAHDAVRAAARTELGLDDAGAERLARIVVALAADFDASTDCGIGGNGNAITRLAEAVCKAEGELRATPTTELALPYLGATSRGPCHLQRKITLAELDALGRGS